MTARVRAAAVLPVRYASTRLPGKPLLAETGKTLVQHVWEQVSRATTLDPVVVATDDERIADVARGFGADVELTDPGHPSGSDRVAEVAARRGFDMVLNVQGDEPEVDPGDLDRLVHRLVSGGDELATLARPLRADEQALYLDPNAVKVVIDDGGHALYFSRRPLPYGLEDPERAAAAAASATSGAPADVALLGAYLHVGVYAWRGDALLRFAAAPPAPIERAERLEQLRALAMGMRVAVELTHHDALGIDTPEDYARFLQRMKATPDSGPSQATTGTRTA